MSNHPTKLIINLKAIVHNFNYYKSLVPSKTKIMVMVKGLSYGCGTHEVAQILEKNNVDYLGVAFTKEGLALRKAGINTKIIVMNPDDDVDEILKYNLEPTFFCFSKLKQFIGQLKSFPNANIPIHIKINTGMNRLGFNHNEVENLISILKEAKNYYVKSVFSHLAASDEEIHDSFTRQQISEFKKIVLNFENALPYKFTKHIANSLATERFPEASFDMVRIGIGLYGFSPFNQGKLLNVSTLKTKISQIRKVRKGETVGYNRKWVVDNDSEIAIIPIGYGDGINRKLSNGVGQVFVNKKQVSIIGNVCMDICMLDVTGINAKEDDDVIIFGDDYTANDVAKRLNTISYEVITGITERVERVYV